MYFSRNGEVGLILAWLLLIGLSWVGGWLIATHLFRQPPRYRLITGLATGSILFIVFSNVLTYLFPLVFAYWFGALLILVVGYFCVKRSDIQTPTLFGEVKWWPQVLALGGLTVLFALINRSLAIFDDYHNLPIVSLLAAGDAPPNFYLNPSAPLAYHYGLHLFAASLVRIAGLFTWSALDLSKSFFMALTLMTAWIWFRRTTRNEIVGLAGVILLLLGGGTRWLLGLLPAPLVVSMSSNLEMLGSALDTGPDLYTNLASPWLIDGGGPIPFPFAFINGIATPMLFDLHGSATLPQLTVLLLLLFAQKRWSPSNGIIYGFILGSLALTAEHYYVLVFGGVLGALLFGWIITRSLKDLLHWLWPLAPSLALAFLGGGVLTEIGRRALFPIIGVSVTEGIGFTGLGLRWPPLVISAQLGPLSLSDPNHIIIALLEIGPILLLSIPVVIWARRQIGYQSWFKLGLGIASIFGFFAPLFIVYQVRERDISRIITASLFLWMVFGFPLGWYLFKRNTGMFMRSLLLLGYVVTILVNYPPHYKQGLPPKLSMMIGDWEQFVFVYILYSFLIQSTSTDLDQSTKITGFGRFFGFN